MKSAAGGARFGAAITMGGLSATRFIAPKIGAGLKGAGKGFVAGSKNMGSNIKEYGFFKGIGHSAKDGLNATGGLLKKTGAGIKAKAGEGAEFLKTSAGALGDGIANGAVFSPNALRSLYYARKDAKGTDEYKALQAAKKGGNADEIKAAQEAFNNSEKGAALRRKQVATKGAGIVNMEMGLEMGKDAIKDLIPGSGLYDKFKKNIDGAKKDELGGNAIGSNLKSRIDQMKQDAADKKAEKKYADIYDAFGREGEGVAVDNVIEKLRNTYSEQEQYCEECNAEIENIIKDQKANKIDETEAKAKMAAILRSANSLNLPVSEDGGKPKISPRIDTSEIKRLEDLKKVSSKSEFDKQLKSIISDWSKKGDKSYEEMIKTVVGGLEEVTEHMKANNKKKK
jgi:hypothetical protein